MRWFVDFQNRKIRLTDERFEHIISDHPEMSDQVDNIKYTLANPDIVIRSRTDSEADLFYRYYSGTPVGGKIVEYGRLKGVPTPFSVAMTNLVKAIEAGHSRMQEIKDPYGL
jgi:hypothetical protein